MQVLEPGLAPVSSNSKVSEGGVTKIDAPAVKVPRVTGEKVFSNVTLLIFGVLFIIPLLWLFLASFDKQATLAIQWPHFTLSNFQNVLTSGNIQSLVSSLELSAISTGVATVAGTFAAYAFSRRHIPWKGPWLLVILFLTGVPITVMIIPVYQIFVKADLLSLVPAAIFLGITSMPLEIWIIKNFIDAVPRDLEESASIEQASTFQILRRIVLPLALPGIGAAAIFGFVNAWGSFLIPLVLITNPSQQPGPVTIYDYIGASTIHYGEIAAFSLIYSIPVVLLYLLLGKGLRGGFLFGGATK
jgi:multiple sugar transport system permease protein